MYFNHNDVYHLYWSLSEDSNFHYSLCHLLPINDQYYHLDLCQSFMDGINLHGILLSGYCYLWYYGQPQSNDWHQMHFLFLLHYWNYPWHWFSFYLYSKVFSFFYCLLNLLQLFTWKFLAFFHLYYEQLVDWVLLD